MTRAHLATATAAYIGAVVLANYLTAHLGLVPAGPGLLVTAGTYAAGAALLARDFVHRHATARWGHRRGIGYVLGCIALAGVLSWATSTPALALASTVAFLTAEGVDLGVFIPVRERAGFLVGALASNVVSAPVDTMVFLAVAGFPLTWSAVGGQFVAKVIWATVVPLALWWLATTRSRRQVRAWADA